MRRIRSSELLALIINEDIPEVSILYSELYDIKEELRRDMIFCDFTVMDFEDLYISYPRNVTIHMDRVILSSKEVSDKSFWASLVAGKDSKEEARIIEILKKYLKK